MFVEHSGNCSGRIMLKLQCLGGLAAVWLTDSPNGVPVSINGKSKGRSTFSFSCSEGKDAVRTEVQRRALNIGGLVHTLNIHGGVRRYLELGNAFVSGGNSYHLFAETLQEKRPWLNFKGQQHPYYEYSSQKLDIIFTGAHESFRDLFLADADKRVVLVVAKFYADKYIKLWRERKQQLKWIGVASDWNKGMEEIYGVCIPGGVNTKFFTPVFPTQERKPVVVFYARAGEGRGTEKIINLAKILWDDATFVGFDAPDYPTISGRLPSNMQIVQTPTQEKLREVLQSADIVVSCMRSAGWNNVVTEGAACGCVPIANDAGTKDVILHGRTGFMCSSQWFEKEAAEYIRHLAGNRDVLNRMARRANVWVQQFDWDIVAEKIITEVYR
jgi:glycosyltransferase involved in cell wall biosynthesis